MARSTTQNVVALPSPTRKMPRGVWGRIAALAQAYRRHSAPIHQRRNPFMPASPLPGVIGENRKPPALAMDAADAWKKFAMDDYSGAVESAGGWVAGSGQNYYASAYAEGQEWLGYAVLALLYQRPEYRIMVDTAATEMTREWIVFKSKSGDKSKAVRSRIEKLEERLRELNLRDVMAAANRNDGSEGRGQVYVDTGKPDDRDELRLPLDTSTPEGVRAIKAKYGLGKFIQRLGAIEPMWCYPAAYEASDPLKASWYEPSLWWVMGKEVSRHRLLTFVGNPVPDIIKPAYSFGGIATTQMAKPYVDFWLRNRTSESDLLNNFSMRVLATEMDVSTADEGQELFERARALNALADNQGVLLINKQSEEFDIRQTSLSGVPEITKQSMERMTIPSQMPIVKFFGNQPSGLNADSEGVIRMWYDTIKARQERVNRPVIQTIVELCSLEEFDEIIDDIVFDFVDLWQLDAAGKSAIQLTKAQIIETDIASGVIDPQEGRLARAKDEDSPYEGLDLEEGEAPGEQIEEEQEEGTGEGGEKGPFNPRPQTEASGRVAREVEGKAASFGGGATGGFKATNDDEAWRRIDQALDEFQESEHPRDNTGKFTRSASAVGGASKKFLLSVSHHDAAILNKHFGAPESGERRKIADHVRAAGKAIPALLVSHVQEEKEKAVNAALALKSLALGRAPSPEELRGLRQFGISIVMSSVSFMTHGDPTGTVGYVAFEFTKSVVEHTMLEHGAKFGAGSARAVYEALRRRLSQGQDSADDDLDTLLQSFIEDLADALENAEFDDSGAENDWAEDRFTESDHPRDNDGKFSVKSGGQSVILQRASEDRSTWPPHIKKLKVPPAWTDIAYSEDPKSPLQAIGRDAKGRAQHIYSERFKDSQTAKKFARIKKLDSKFDTVVQQNERALRGRDAGKREHAAVTALIMDMGLRPGSERDTGAAEQAFGATTLRAEHVKTEGDETSLVFTGKKGVHLNLPVKDSALAADLRQRAARGGQLFPDVTAASLRQYVGSLGGGGFKTKDLRTLKASQLAGVLVAQGEAPTSPTAYKQAVKAVAVAVSKVLGNTPTVALQSYISPVVFAEWRTAAGVK